VVVGVVLAEVRHSAALAEVLVVAAGPVVRGKSVI